MRRTGVKEFVSTFFFLSMIVWMCFLLLLSPIPNKFKVLYLFMLFSVVLLTHMTEGLRAVFCFGIMILSSIFTLLSPTQAVQTALLFGLLGTIGVMFLYIPADMMLIFVTILIAGTYSTVIVSFFALNQDAYLTGFFVPLMVLLWVCVIHARPPLRR